MVKKKKNTRKKTTKRKSTSRITSVREDSKSRRKYNRGGRMEAYTFGEAQGSKNWP